MSRRTLVIRQVDALGVFGLLLVALLLAVAFGAMFALAFGLLGIFYNLTGRVQVEVDEQRAGGE
jgi:uncharacterized protein (DUF58 family)